ncbi:MAG: hypothetical protein P9L94_08895 [Candidatus Hinthialibacter antarcticus]|nr:hypothetical protein [Candidatus Hinthialibacter antarcticus]
MLLYQRFYCPLLLFSTVCLIQTSSVFAQDWGYWWGNELGTFHFDSPIQTSISEQISVTSFELNISFDDELLVGDVLGSETQQIIGVNPERLSLVVFDPMMNETLSVPLVQPSEISGTGDEVFLITQLFNYDDIEGMEVFCSIGNRANQRPVFQIVSPAKQSVLTHFEGLPIQDVDGDEIWNGAENGLFAFQSPSGKWKFISRSSAGHSDYKPRSLNIWDIETEELQAQFHTATPPPFPTFVRQQDGSTRFFFVPLTPDNWIKVDGVPILDENGNYINVSETFAGMTVKDNEAYDFCLKFDDSDPNQPPLTLEWYNKRGELMSGRGMITKSKNGTLYGVSWDDYIRIWDSTSTGAIHVYNFESGEIVAEHHAEEGKSFMNAVISDGDEQLFAIYQEEPVLQRYDLFDGLQGSVNVSDDDNARVEMTGISDMDGNGSPDVILEIIEFGQQCVCIYNSDLTLLSKLSMPYLQDNASAIADIDRDGYPEVYFIDKVSHNIVHQLEYISTSNAKNYHLY